MNNFFLWLIYHRPSSVLTLYDLFEICFFAKINKKFNDCLNKHQNLTKRRYSSVVHLESNYFRLNK